MKLLIAEHPLQVLPSLAVAIGLNEAIVLQQMHYWSLMPNTLVHEGLRWIYNSMPEWQAQFPFWSEDTIARAMRSLRDRGLISVKRLSQNPMDRRNYYAIVYGKLRVVDIDGISCLAPTTTPPLPTPSPARLGLSQWRGRRKAVLDRGGHRCVYCGSGTDITVDHVVPRAKGGSDDESNLVVACRSCNSSKGASSVADWSKK